MPAIFNPLFALLCVFGLLICVFTPAQSQAATGEMKVRITAGDQVLTATFEDNATSRALAARFPLTVPMQDLYAREMCYHFPEALPANEAGYGGYEVGDISYWTPRHSLVIFYEQNGERIGNLQKIGHIDSGVEFFKMSGDIAVTFELIE